MLVVLHRRERQTAVNPPDLSHQESDLTPQSVGTSSNGETVKYCPQMHVCLVLGAGATLANALHFHSQRRSSRNPPLDYTFFDKIESLEIPIPSQLRAYAMHHAAADPFGVRPGMAKPRMETFFRDLFIDFQEAKSPTALPVRAYSQLVDIYVRVLRETTDWLGEDSRKGAPIGRLIDASARVADQVTIITFNHDLVIENELLRRAKLQKRWCLEHGYGSIGSRLMLTHSSGPKFPLHSVRCSGEPDIKILKLHGSLNWYVRMNGKMPSRTVLAGGASSPPQLFCSRRRAVPHQLRYTKKRSGPGRSEWYTWPVVVPPIHAKDALIRSLLPESWEDAMMALKAADRVVFFGYSAPDLDLSAERLFRRSIKGNGGLRWIDVVNPAPESAQRYAEIGSPVPLRWYTSVADLLTTME